MEHAWSTSWGVSTRLIGAMIMAHGDDDGLVVPPMVAPTHVVIVPIYKGEEEAAELKGDVDAMVAALTAAGVKVRSDMRENLRPGAKFFEWEKKGVPVRVEYGARDKADGNVVVKRRDTGEKQVVPVGDLAQLVPQLLCTIQGDMLARARRWRDERSFSVDSYDEFKTRIEDGGFFHMRWCGDAGCEARVKEETKATIRCLPHAAAADPGPCVVCGAASEGVRAIFARAY